MRDGLRCCHLSWLTRHVGVTGIQPKGLHLASSLGVIVRLGGCGTAGQQHVIVAGACEQGEVAGGRGRRGLPRG